jgi:Flp pilus assembly protein TadG
MLTRKTAASDNANRSRRRGERGTAVVEFAVVAPLLFAVVLAIMEFGRGMMVAENLGGAARAGCRAASLSGATTSSATAVINNDLNLIGITGTTVNMSVNGASTDVGNAVSGDTVTVTVTVPYSAISWLPTASSSYLQNITLSGKASMVRE